MEWSAVGTRRGTTLRGAGSTIFLGFSKLGDNGDTFQFLASQLQCLGDGFLILKLNIADAADVSWVWKAW